MFIVFQILKLAFSVYFQCSNLLLYFSVNNNTKKLFHYRARQKSYPYEKFDISGIVVNFFAKFTWGYFFGAPVHEPIVFTALLLYSCDMNGYCHADVGPTTNNNQFCIHCSLTASP